MKRGIGRGLFRGTARNRLVRLENFYERNIEYFMGIPNIGLSAINLILEELFTTRKMPKHNMVLLKIRYFLRLNPQIKHEHERIIYEYSARFFKKLYYITERSKRGEDFFRIDLQIKKLIISWGKNFQEHQKIFLLEDLLYCADLNATKFKVAVGMAVKKTSRRGVFKIGGHFINLSVKHKKKFVLVFFDKGNLFIFDFRGRKIIPISAKLI
ncbi:hypothetical protein JW977_01220 [Candidatus Falkowbacteria bacterium]|nr:hypothetical protein [Candidatus Falkowbacteria bacterium]